MFLVKQLPDCLGFRQRLIVLRWQRGRDTELGGSLRRPGQRHVDLEDRPLAGRRMPANLAAGLRDDPGGAGKPEAEPAARLAAAVERVEEMQTRRRC